MKCNMQESRQLNSDQWWWMHQCNASCWQQWRRRHLRLGGRFINANARGLLPKQHRHWRTWRGGYTNLYVTYVIQLSPWQIYCFLWAGHGAYQYPMCNLPWRVRGVSPRAVCKSDSSIWNLAWQHVVWSDFLFGVSGITDTADVEHSDHAQHQPHHLHSAPKRLRC